MNFEDFKWLNPSSHTMEAGKLIITAPPLSDFFCGEAFKLEDVPASLCNAPFYYTEVTGDFVLRAKVSLDFKDTYDSATLMVMQNEKLWGKLCFEKTDFDTTAVVSVVTNGCSDDANGCNVTAKSVWLQIARSSQGFAFHYSLDGEKFDMVRFFSLTVDETLKVGFVAQAPTGQGGDRIFENITLNPITLKNLRNGN